MPFVYDPVDRRRFFTPPRVSLLHFFVVLG
jgi:hypothetical protein